MCGCILLFTSNLFKPQLGHYGHSVLVVLIKKTVLNVGPHVGCITAT